jgi:hypothetical protein
VDELRFFYPQDIPENLFSAIRRPLLAYVASKTGASRV